MDSSTSRTRCQSTDARQYPAEQGTEYAARCQPEEETGRGEDGEYEAVRGFVYHLQPS